MLGRGRQLAVAAILVLVASLIPDAFKPVLAAGTPAPGYAVTDFATGFGTFLPWGPGPVGLAFDSQGNLYSTGYLSGNLYKFPSTGGTFETSLLSNVGFRVTGLAFDKSGRLFVARQAQGDVLQLDPASGGILGTVSSGICNPNAVAVDPISNDLFISSCGRVLRLTGYQGTPVAPALYTDGVSVDGLTFAPDGTLYGTGGGPIYRIVGTSDPAQGTSTVIANVPLGDGIALVAPQPGQPITQLVVNTNSSNNFTNDGTIDLVDFSSNPATITPIVTGGSRGDFVAVGPDKCLYATQSDEIEKVTASDGSCPFLPTGVASAQLTFCPKQGQMVNNFSLDSIGWSMNYGISACEGLVISNVALGPRLMAERMSLPYVDIDTCASVSNIANCGAVTTRHITLQPDAAEPQADATAFTHVRLMTPSPGMFVIPPGTPPASAPCNGSGACLNTTVVSAYRVDLNPTPDTTYVDIVQRYEFYKDTGEKAADAQGLSCEPAQGLPDCARWKPIVFYTFTDGTRTTLLKRVNAVIRLHFTPDAMAERASTFIRDCDKSAPSDGCFPSNPFNNFFEVYAPNDLQTSIRQEAAIRGLAAASDGTTHAGRYDNVHQTPDHEVVSPLPPPGCPECVHIHWRWGKDIPFVPAFYGQGQPLIGDAEPAAQPNPLSHQQLDVAMVPYHSEQLAPNNYLLLLKVANSNILELSINANKNFVGGIAKGPETLSYPPLTCADQAHLASWGQCGQVLYMSATSFTNNAHDEDSDTFFAFGGFFCQACIGLDYSSITPGLAPTYKADGHSIPKLNIAPGSTVQIKFTGVQGALQLNDVLPAGFTVVSASFATPAPNRGGKCSFITDVDGHPVVTCNLPILPVLFDVTIDATAGGSMAPGEYQNTVHAIWGPIQGATELGGNYKRSAILNIT